MPPKMKVFQEKCQYKFAYGGRGGGKSESALKIVLYEANERKIRALFTREIQNSIKDSVYGLLCDLIAELEYTDYHITNKDIRHKNGSHFIFAGLNRQEKTQSVKSYANIDLCIVEEAQSISEQSLNVLDPTIRKNGAEIWFLFNRIFNNDPIWQFMKRVPENQRKTVFINFSDNPYLPETLLKKERIAYNEYKNKLNDDYPHIWLGQPRGYSEKSVFKLTEINEAMSREVSPEGQEEVGVDVARHGDDKTVFVKRKGLKIIDIAEYPKTTIDDIVELLMSYINFNKNIRIKIDDTGVGGGVTDYMIKWGYNIIPINFGQSAKDIDKYNNAASEMWFELKENIDKYSLMDYSDLADQLCAREWSMDIKGRRVIESKKRYKEREGRSPDLADALILSFYSPDVIDYESFLKL